MVINMDFEIDTPNSFKIAGVDSETHLTILEQKYTELWCG